MHFADEVNEAADLAGHANASEESTKETGYISTAVELPGHHSGNIANEELRADSLVVDPVLQAMREVKALCGTTAGQLSDLAACTYACLQSSLEDNSALDQLHTLRISIVECGALHTECMDDGKKLVNAINA